MSIRIAVQIPVGPIDRMGYQFNTKLVLENMSYYFDHVLVLSNSAEIRELPFSSERIEYVPDTSTSPGEGDSRQSAFNLDRIYSNNDMGLSRLADRGFDVCIQGDILQYIDEQNADRLYSLCKEMISNGRPWEYKYRAFQILDQVCVPSLRGARVLNLHFFGELEMRLRADQLEIENRKIRAERGIFYDAPCFFIDIYPPIWTEADYNEKYEYYLVKIDELYGRSPRDRNWMAQHENDRLKAAAQIPIPGYRLSHWGQRALENLPRDSPVRNWNFDWGNN